MLLPEGTETQAGASVLALAEHNQAALEVRTALHALKSLRVLGLRNIEPEPDLCPTLKPSFSSETYWKGFRLIDLGSTLDFNSNLLHLVIWCRFFNVSELPFSLPQSRVIISNLIDSYEDSSEIPY